MDHELHIHLFGHYLSLFVEFTFAYAGWEAFKHSINRIALHEEPTFLKSSKRLQEIIDQSPALSEDPALDEAMKKNASSAKTIAENLLENDKRAQRVYNGKNFQPLFYLIGAIYLSVLILGGFQREGLNQPIFMYILITSILTFLYQLKVLKINQIEAQGNFSYPQNTRWRNSPYVIIFHALWFIGMMCVCILLSQFIHIEKWCEIKLHPLCHEFCLLAIFKNTIMIMLLALPILPYWRFYNRKKLYLDAYQKRYDDGKKEMDRLLLIIESNKEKESIIHKQSDTIEQLKKEKQISVKPDSEPGKGE